jgi:hypothetical protein
LHPHFTSPTAPSSSRQQKQCADPPADIAPPEGHAETPPEGQADAPPEGQADAAPGADAPPEGQADAAPGADAPPEGQADAPPEGQAAKKRACEDSTDSPPKLRKGQAEGQDA